MITWNDQDKMIISNIIATNHDYKRILPDDVEFKRSKKDSSTSVTIIVNNASKYLNNHQLGTITELKQGKWKLREYYPITEIDDNNVQYLSEFVLTLHKDNWLLTMRIPY